MMKPSTSNKNDNAATEASATKSTMRGRVAWHVDANGIQAAGEKGPRTKPTLKRSSKIESATNSPYLNSAIIAMGVNLRGCETPNCAEPQPRAQVPRSTTLIPTPKGTAEQRTTGT